MTKHKPDSSFDSASAWLPLGGFLPISRADQSCPKFEAGSVPNHVAIVMDGNGRWANQRGLTRVEGHKAGEAALLDVVAGALEAGVKYLTVYAFSTENWKRSPDEVRFLMGFNREVLRRRRDQLNAWGVRIRWAGRRPKLWASVIDELQEAEQLTAKNTKLTLTMCVTMARASRSRMRSTRWLKTWLPAVSSRGQSPRRRLGVTSAATGCPMSTCSCAARGSSAHQTSCFGRAHTPNLNSHRPCGLTSVASTCGRRLAISRIAIVALVEPKTSPISRAI